jgi:hypothetical protein
MGVREIAWANLANAACRSTAGPASVRLSGISPAFASAPSRQLSLFEAIRPAAVLVAVSGAREGGDIVLVANAAMVSAGMG